MDVIKKFQYSLILFVMAATILLTGLLPCSAKLFHRLLWAPEEYASTTGVIVEISQQASGANFEFYPVYVEFVLESPEGKETIVAQLDHYSDTMELGQELELIYHMKNPQTITLGWTQARDFFLYVAFVALGVLTGMMMMSPPSPVVPVRPRRSLRERLEKY